MPLTLKIVIGSTRPGRKGPAVGAWAAKAAEAHGGFAVELVDLADFDLPLLDEAAHPSQQKYEHAHTKRWSAAMAPADAVVFVTPEYDYFPPAGLVNAVQCLHREWRYKPAGVVSYGGITGGMRSSGQLKLLLGGLGIAAIPQGVSLPFFGQHIGEDGLFTPPEGAAKQATGMLDELVKWAGALKTLRD